MIRVYKTTIIFYLNGNLNEKQRSFLSVDYRRRELTLSTNTNTNIFISNKSTFIKLGESILTGVYNCTMFGVSTKIIKSDEGATKYS